MPGDSCWAGAGHTPRIFALIGRSKASRDEFTVKRHMLVLLTEPACTGLPARRESSIVTLAMGKVLQRFYVLQEGSLILLGLQRETGNPTPFLFRSPCFRLSGGRLAQTLSHGPERLQLQWLNSSFLSSVFK